MVELADHPQVLEAGEVLVDRGVLAGEADATAPLNVYGQSKARMEDALLGLDGEHLIIRTAAFFSPHDRHNFAVHAMARLHSGIPLQAAGDQIMSPTFVPDLCNAVLDLLIDGETGIWHLSNGEGLNWASFAERLALACGLDPDLVQPSPGIAIGWTAPRPANSSLGTSRGALLPSLDTAIARFAEVWTGRHDHSIGEAPVTAMVAPET